MESFLSPRHATHPGTAPTSQNTQVATQIATQVVLVEDDVELAKWVQEYLQQHAIDTHIVSRGDQAVAAIKAIEPALVLLDIMLPGKDGHQVCRELREFYPHPILILTANNQELDEVLSLELGADDYLAKPVRPRVLLARIKALLRRVSTGSASSTSAAKQLKFGQLTLDAVAKSVTLYGQPVSLSSTEFELLWELASHAGEIMSRQRLSQQLRGIDYDGFDRAVDVRVSRLRKKLHDHPQEPTKIKTVWGKGYLFVPSAW